MADTDLPCLKTDAVSEPAVSRLLRLICSRSCAANGQGATLRRVWLNRSWAFTGKVPGHGGFARAILGLLCAGLSACAPFTILHDFHHTSLHCESWQRSDRCYYLVTPDRANAQTRLPVRRTLPPALPDTSAIVFLHPALASPGMFEWLTGFAEAAVERGQVVVYPMGVANTWNDGRGGRSTIPEWLNLDDPAWIRKVLSELQEKGIHKVYLMGMSSGGMLAMNLYCDPASFPDGTELAGLATVVSNLPGSEVRDCHPRQPASVLAVFGQRDWILQEDGGEVLWMKLLFGNTVSAQRSVDTLRASQRCADEARTQRFDQDGDGKAAVERRYLDCSTPGISVTHITLEDASHIWPGEPAWTAWLTARGFATVEMEGNDYILDWTRNPDTARIHAVGSSGPG